MEQVVNRHFVLGVVVHRALEEETQEALDTEASCASGEVAEEHEVEAERSGEDGVAAEEVNLNLHWIAHPAKDIDIVPALFVVVAGWVVVDAHFVIVAAVEVGLSFGNEDRLESGEFAHLFGVEVGRLIEYETVAVAEDVCREPT